MSQEIRKHCKASTRTTSGGRSHAVPGSALEIIAEHAPVHPGTILRDESLAEMNLTPYAVAQACHIPRSNLERIVRGDLGISGDTAVRLGRYFGTSDRFWMNLQPTDEVMRARQAIGDKLDEIEPLSGETA